MADDDESLDDILSSPKPETAETPEIIAEEQPTPPRDEHGRFAPRAEDQPEPEPEQAEQPEPETEHNAPVGAVIAERRKAQQERERADKLERDLAEMRGQMSVLMQRANQPAQQQPQPEPVKPPNWYEDPDGALTHALSPVQQQLAEMTFQTSRAVAFAEFGKDTVLAANEAMKAAVERGELDGAAVKAQLAKSRDPVGDVVRWHQSSPAVQETTLRQKIEAELLAKYGIDPSQPPATPSPQPSPRNPIVKLPPSLSRIPAGHSAPERDESLDEVLSAPRRRA